MRIKIRGVFFLTLGALGLMLFFQNCSPPLNTSKEDASSFNNSLDFAFESQLDHVAYMSCSDMGSNYDPRAYFTFRAGAYNPGSGVKVTQAYLDEVSHMSETKKIDALSGDNNSGAQMQLALRGRSNVNAVLGASTGIHVEDKDYGNILGPLDSSIIAHNLVNIFPGEYVNYFKGVTGLDGRLMEGSIRFLDHETLASSVRASLSSSTMLSLTYASTDTSLPVLARGPANQSTKAYGVGYTMNFNFGFGIDNSNSALHPLYTAGEARVMRNLREVDMLTNQDTGVAWQCSNDMTFVIVRSQDIVSGLVVCEIGAEDPKARTTQDQTVYQALRNVIRVEDYWVNLDRRCIVPKNNTYSCYGDPLKTINYQGGNCGSRFNNVCPHYVSLCVKQ